MLRFFKVLLYFNLGALIRGLRFGLREFEEACRGTLYATRPFERADLQAFPVADLDEIMGERRPEIRLTVLPEVDGALQRQQLVALLAILVAEAPAQVLEIGTYMGSTTRMIAENLPEAIVHTVDLPEDFSQAADTTVIPKDDFHLIARRRVGSAYKGQPCEARIRQHFVDTAKWDFQEAAGTTFFYIDGSHTYEYIKNDTEKCLRLCEGRAVFLWHDCDGIHPKVVQYLSELREQGKNIRLIRHTALAHWVYEGGKATSGN